MKIILDTRDLTIRLDQMLALEGLQLDAPPEWEVSEGEPNVVLTIRSIPVQERSPDLAASIADQLMPLIAAQLAEPISAVRASVSEVAGMMSDTHEGISTLNSNLDNRTNIESRGISKPIGLPTLSPTNAPVALDGLPPDISPQGVHFPGLDKNLREHTTLMEELERELTEETGSDTFTEVVTT